MYSSRDSSGSSPHRLPRLLILSAGLIGLLAATSAGATERDTILWVNPAGGDWSTASNWSPANVPDSETEAAVLKPLSSAYTVTLDANTTVGGLWVQNGGPELDVRGVALQINGIPVNRGTIRITNGGTLHPYYPLFRNWGGTVIGGNGGGHLIVCGPYVSQPGTLDNTMNGAATTTGGTLVTDGGDLTVFTGMIVNGEVQRISGTGAVDIQMANPQNLTVAANSEVLISGLLDLMVSGSSLMNHGTVRVSGTIQCGGPGCDSVSFAGDGVMVLEEGTLNTPTGTPMVNATGHTIRGCGTIAGNMVNRGEIDIECPFSSTQFLGPVLNTGTIRVKNGLAWMKGAASHLSNPSTVFVTNGALWVDEGATLDNTGGVLNANGGYVEFGRNTSCTILGGRLEGAGGIFYSEGTTTLRDVTLGPTALLQTSYGATTLVTGARLLNQGTLRISTTGTVTVNASTDYIQTGGATVLEGGRLNASREIQIQGGALRGSGVVAASVSNAGEVGPDATSGALTIQGDYRQLSNARLSVGLAGSGPNQTSRLNVTGGAFLDGTIAASTIGGYSPAAGDRIQVLTYGAVSGQFSQFIEPNLGGSLNLEPVYSSADFGLSVTGVAGVDDPAVPTVLAFSGRRGAGQASFVLALPRDAVVTVRAYDIVGREIATLADGPRPAGVHTFALGNASRTLSNGVYFARALVQGGGQVETRTARVVLLR
jgi:hypothetical protein